MASKLIEFNAPAMFKLVVETPILNDKLREDYGYRIDNNTIALSLNGHSINGRFSLALRRLLRRQVENKELHARYLDLLYQELNQEKLEQTWEFQIKITGSGTKTAVIEELENVIFHIKQKTIQELNDGQEWESPVLMTETTEPDVEE